MNLQQPRRIVSKSRYLRYLSQKAALGGSGMFLFMIGVIGAVTCVTGLGALLVGAIIYRHTTLRDMLGYAWGCLSIGAIFAYGTRIGIRQMDRGRQLERLVPLTRQNTEQLPAEQSLVRASSEPAEQQQAVLLRAASSDTQTPAHELLRATTQEEKL